MTRRQVQQLRPGDQVHWDDPDNGLCSKTITIQEIEATGDIVHITDISGGELECYAKELS